nr:thioester domain-containing protein [Nocardiopsis algeriensis]
MSIPRAFGRTAVAGGAAALLALGLAAPAAAEGEGAVRAQYVRDAQKGDNVRLDIGTASTSLFELKLENGETLTAYCIDLKTGIVPQAWYVEDSWSQYNGQGNFAEARGKVHWILQNSYPTVGVEQLAENADLGNRAHRFTEKEAIAATQAAIWHFTNGVKVTANSPDSVRKVYDYLVGNAQDLPQEPAPTLSITPESATGEAGGTVGEFTVSTSAEAVPVDLTAPEGVELVDAETGEAVTTVDNGDTVAFSVPAGTEPGEASFSLVTGATISAGRLFKGENGLRTQTLITAKNEEVSVSADASVTWTTPETPEVPEEPETPEEPEAPETPEEPETPETPEAPEEPSVEPSTPAEPKVTPPADDKPSLPVTGGALAGLVGVGVAALGAGGAAIYFSRKRKSAASNENIG